MKRIFLMVLDSAGIGELPDAAEYGDCGSNTWRACFAGKSYAMPNLERLGFWAIEGVRDWYPRGEGFLGAVGRLAEASKGKDTTTGHWEIAGIISERPMPLFPEGFPEKLTDAIKGCTGRGILCNRPYSGTDAIRDFGEEHIRTGALILYTSADSVLQIAAHERIVPVEELYEICRKVRALCTGDFAVGRVIARPFDGEPGGFFRTSRRHDFSLEPPKDTMLDLLSAGGKDVLAVGKINDIFAGRGITEYRYTGGNREGIDRTLEYMKRDFEGICFTNLVDYDMLYGHRNDVDGYAAALSEFDRRLPELLAGLKEGDILMITADHGCDPSTPSTDHSREYVPLVAAGPSLRQGVNLGTRKTFADIAATVLDYFGLAGKTAGESFLEKLL